MNSPFSVICWRLTWDIFWNNIWFRHLILLIASGHFSLFTCFFNVNSFNGGQNLTLMHILWLFLSFISLIINSKKFQSLETACFQQRQLSLPAYLITPSLQLLFIAPVFKSQVSKLNPGRVQSPLSAMSFLLLRPHSPASAFGLFRVAAYSIAMCLRRSVTLAGQELSRGRVFPLSSLLSPYLAERKCACAHRFWW